MERHRLMWRYLRDESNLLQDCLKVLHFAPEPALQARFRAMPNLDYVSADLCSPRADVHFDICLSPYPDDTFDVILCSHVLEHILDDRKAMSELFRVMKPGGWGIIEVPLQPGRRETFEDQSVTTPTERERVFGQRDHVRIYGKDYYDRLRSAGFEVRLESFGSHLGAELIERYRLPQNGGVCLCFKPAH